MLSDSYIRLISALRVCVSAYQFQSRWLHSSFKKQSIHSLVVILAVLNDSIALKARTSKRFIIIVFQFCVSASFFPLPSVCRFLSLGDRMPFTKFIDSYTLPACERAHTESAGVRWGWNCQKNVHAAARISTTISVCLVYMVGYYVDLRTRFGVFFFCCCSA